MSSLLFNFKENVKHMVPAIMAHEPCVTDCFMYKKCGGKSGSFPALACAVIQNKGAYKYKWDSWLDWQCKYLLILKSISWPHFNYFDKLWICMSCNGLGNNIKEKQRRWIPLKRTLNTGSQSSSGRGMLRDMLFLTWATVCLKDRWNPRTKT